MERWKAVHWSISPPLSKICVFSVDILFISGEALFLRPRKSPRLSCGLMLVGSAFVVVGVVVEIVQFVFDVADLVLVL